MQYGPLLDPDSEIECFISALQEIFHDAPWESIRHHAAKAWGACELAEGMPWKDVEDRIRANWPSV